MPNGSAVFAAARVSASEYKLLNTERYSRMLDGSPQDAIKVLYEIGYGDGITVPTVYDYDVLIAKEFDETVKFIRSISPSDKVTDCFFLFCDYHNAKVVVKSKFLKTSKILDILYTCGKIDIDYLKNCVLTESYSFLPEFMSDAFKKIDAQALNGNVTPSFIDLQLDLAYQLDLEKRLKKIGNKSVVSYFKIQTDLKNIAVIVRLKKLDVKEGDVEKYIMPCGTIEKSQFLRLHSFTFDGINDYFKYTNYKEFVSSLIEAVINNESISEYEKLIDNFMLKIFRKYRNDYFSINIVIGYFVAKLIELKNVRIIMTGLINNVEKTLIQKRLRESYV